MQFKEFLYLETEQQFLGELQKFVQNKPKLPKPTTLLDTSSNDTYVFNTTNPDVVIRLASERRSHCEEIMADEEMQETGGVTKVYFIYELMIDGNEYIVSWKEKVDEFVEGFLRRNYPEEFKELGWLLSALYHIRPDGLRMLGTFAPTKNLAMAIKHGLPVSDLALESNLGVTKDGRIVAFDC